MDKEIKKDVEFCEAINDDMRRDPLMEQAMSRSKPIQDYVSNVILFENMTGEEFFTAPAYGAYAAEIRAMREAYDKLAEADTAQTEADNGLAEQVAELQKAIKKLTESTDAKPADTAPPADVVVADETDEGEIEAKPEVEIETED